MHEQVEKTVLTPCTVPISSEEAFIPRWVSACQLSAVTKQVNGYVCGLSHKHVEGGCKGTCMKFVG